ncbi:hypothetical protein F7725_001644 [Dissostichus mawsoni]|uniref:Uncharacterized protein n=1 Tax=Dissostichus mawsoni TaxID=36200 RepID=A0A7J5Y067_DISMA|nr:hypothetical protein F7725_001644 [Dissostichus mawsoni]
MQLAKMSKLLMAIELDTKVYKGKSLDDLDLDLGTQMMVQNQKMQRKAELVLVQTSGVVASMLMDLGVG